MVGPDSQVALLTQATPAEVTQGDTGAGGAGPVPPLLTVGPLVHRAEGMRGTDGGPGVEVTPETTPDVPSTSEMSEAESNPPAQSEACG